jgi:acetoin utilization protein AcuB
MVGAWESRRTPTRFHSVSEVLMQVQKIMHTPVVTVRLDDFLREVNTIFEANVVHHVIVVEDDRLVGLIGERDLLRAISPYVNTHVYTTRDLATLNQRVHQIVHRHPKFLRQDATVQDAIGFFNAHHVDCIPIVDAEHAPIGMVTKTDIVRHFSAICADGKLVP